MLCSERAHGSSRLRSVIAASLVITYCNQQRPFAGWFVQIHYTTVGTITVQAGGFKLFCERCFGKLSIPAWYCTEILTVDKLLMRFQQHWIDWVEQSHQNSVTWCLWLWNTVTVNTFIVSWVENPQTGLERWLVLKRTWSKDNQGQGQHYRKQQGGWFPQRETAEMPEVTSGFREGERVGSMWEWMCVCVREKSRDAHMLGFDSTVMKFFMLS